MCGIPSDYAHTAQKKYRLRRSYCHRGRFHSQEVIGCIEEKLRVTWFLEQIACTPRELKMPGWRTIYRWIYEKYLVNGLLWELHSKGRDLSRAAPATLKRNLAFMNARFRKVLNVHSRSYAAPSFTPVALSLTIHYRIIPREKTENMEYRYPDPKHVDFLMSLDDPQFPCEPATILNGDAHIRASFFGASETFILRDSKLLTGSVGYIYFIDWDQNRVRDCKCHVMVMGE